MPAAQGAHAEHSASSSTAIFFTHASLPVPNSEGPRCHPHGPDRSLTVPCLPCHVAHHACRDLGRARVEKYMIQYRFRSQSNVIYDGADPMLTLIYEPLYGPVPGYKQGTPLGPEVRLILRKEGGEEGEWRVFRGIF